MTNRRSRRTSSMLLRAALLGGAVTLTGCGFFSDSDLIAQMQAQEELEAKAAEYANLVAGITVDNGDAAVAARIDQVARQIESIQGMSAQQKKSATALASTMHATAGNLRANAIMELALDQTMLRAQISENVAAAMILAAGSQPRQDSDFSEPMELIEEIRGGVDFQHDQVQQGLSTMQPQYEQLMQQRERSGEQLASLEQDISNLRQQANDAGPLDGYPMVEEAAGVNSRAIPIKSAISEVEMTLASMEPDIERLMMRRDSLEDAREATMRAEATANALHDAVRAAGQEGRTRAEAMIVEMNTNLDAYRARERDEIAPLIEAAMANLQRAQRGAGRGNSGIIAADAARTLGNIHAMRADAGTADMMLFQSLLAGEQLGLGDSTEWQAQVTAAEEARTTSIEAARSAYESALEKLTDGENNASTRKVVENLIAALDGTPITMESIDFSAAPGRGQGRRPGGRPARGGGGLSSVMGTMGYDTPEELATFLGTIGSGGGGPQAAMRKLVGACYTTDQAALAQMDNPQAGAQTMMMMGSVFGGGLDVKSVSGSTGELAPISGPPGMDITFPIIKRNGKWLLDLDALQKQMESMMGSMMDAAMQNMDFGGDESRGFDNDRPSRGTDRPGRGRGRN